jgi:hypothetical protein
MQEEWREILEFPSYSVSNTGFVRNEDFGWMMTRHVNQRGIVNVSFNRNGTQYKRSVTVLVATAFVTSARSLAFDTPINLDGDRINNRADNLMWRPRWYALRYFQQFKSDPQGIDRPIQEFKTGEVFKTSWDAAIKFGLLDTEIVKSVASRTYAWPTYQRFRIHF